MSKRVLILVGLGIVAIIAGIFLLKYELTKEFESEPEPEPKPEPEPEPEPEEEKPGLKKGFYYDRHSKTWIKCKPKPDEPAEQITPGQPAEYLKPEPVVITPG